MGAWSISTLTGNGNTEDPMLTVVTVEVKYLYIVTLSLNVLCAGTLSPTIIILDCSD